MKRFYKLSGDAPSRPIRLLSSIVLAFFVMLFINGFIGSMGGFPAFIAFAVVFYLLRSVMSAGNRITHQIAMSSRQELAFLFVDYSAGYLILWFVLRLGMMLSRVTGWGNPGGVSALAYVKALLQTSLLEQWAYFFVGVFMFAFVLSLFPLVVIRRPSTWAAYAFLDGSGFALLCEIIGALSRAGAGEKPLARGICLIDELLLCVGLTAGQRVLCLAAVLVFALAAGAFAFFFAVRCYGPKPGRMDVDTSAYTPGEFRYLSGDIRVLKRNIFLGGSGIVLFAGIMAFVLFGPKEETPEYEKVAEFLTKDAVLAPMEYEGRIYIPIDEDSDLYESGVPAGYLAHKGESCSGRLYALTVANILYTDPAGSGRLQVYGADIASFAPAEEVEARADWAADEVFLLWDEDWVQESAFSHEPTGYTVCRRDFVEALRRRFGRVEYRSGDFSDYDAYFSLCGYPDMEKASTEELTPGHWAGCILVKDNRFYYGNFDNRITGALLEELLDILGGY